MPLAGDSDTPNVHRLVILHGRERAREMVDARMRPLVDIAAEVLADDTQRNVSTTLIHPGSEFKLNSTASVWLVFRVAWRVATGSGPSRIGSSSCVGPGGVT